jgi:hypothetical protein
MIDAMRTKLVAAAERSRHIILYHLSFVHNIKQRKVMRCDVFMSSFLSVGPMTVDMMVC